MYTVGLGKLWQIGSIWDVPSFSLMERRCINVVNRVGSNAFSVLELVLEFEVCLCPYKSSDSNVGCSFLPVAYLVAEESS